VAQLYPQGAGFHFRRLLRLVGLRWRYSIPPPHGGIKVKVTGLLITPQHVPRVKHCSSVAVKLLPWNHICLRSRYIATAVLVLLISRSLPSNGSTCHNTNYGTLHISMYDVEITSNCMLFIRLFVKIVLFFFCPKVDTRE
jgi:hypothetical protein